jgi:putative membrane protein
MLRAMAPGQRGRAGAVLAWAAGAFLSLAMGIAAYDFVAGLIARWPPLGWLALALVGVALLALVWLAAREWAALMRLGRIDSLRTRAQAARSPDAARRVLAELDRLYAGRPEMAQPRALLAAKAPDLMDADALIRLAERELLAAPDQAARREIEAAARRVATATALVPLALVDVAVALAANLAMIRRVAEIYGGRAGTFGSWRLLRRVFGHLVATGAVAVGDDLISSVAGGGVVSRLSRRFGEGVVNAALTARVGIAAVEVCRPLPFDALERPGTTALVGRALAGFFGTPRER